MKIIIIATRNDGKSAEIILTSEEVEALGDLPYMLEERDWDTFKLNKIEKPMTSACRKFEHLLHDVKNEGKYYACVGKKFMLRKERHYLVKKPKWK